MQASYRPPPCTARSFRAGSNREQLSAWLRHFWITQADTSMIKGTRLLSLSGRAFSGRVCGSRLRRGSHLPALFSTQNGGSPALAGGAATGSSLVDDLRRDAHIAHLSGLCYLSPEQLQPRLESLGLELVAHGNTHFTRWYVADRLPGASPAATPLAAGAAADSAAAGTPPTAAATAPAGSVGTARRSHAPQPGRYIFLRGVSWSAPDSDTWRVWQDLMRCWPAPFQAELTKPAGALVAHSGVSGMATDLWQRLQSFIAEAPGDVHFAGHSLGGSLSLLLTAMSHLQLGMPGHRMTAATFGSPPVLSLSHGEDGAAILEALGMAPNSIRNYVLDNDPVPRALLSVDPTFESLKGWRPVRGLLELRERLLGPGAMLSPSRFLYHTVGPVYLIRWSQDAGHSVLQLGSSEIQEHLTLDVEALRAQPLRLAQALLDHHHGSYAQELRGAASALARRQQQQQAQSVDSA